MIKQEKINSFYTRIKSKQKNELKEKKLIKKLINKLIKDYNLNIQELSLQIGFKTSFNLKTSKHKYFMQNGKMIKEKITINLFVIKNYRLKDGLSNAYYNGRSQKLNPIIKNNLKNCLRFFILHEFAHAYHQRQDLKNKTKLNTEVNADDFAISNLNKYGGKI